MTNSVTRDNPSTIPSSRREREKLLRAYPGLLYRLAKRRKLHSGLLNAVFHGQSKSAKYLAAIEAEIKRRQHDAEEPEAA